MSAIKEIIAERLRQISVKGWSLAHDDEHVNGEMALAAAAYAANTTRVKRLSDLLDRLWPWAIEWWKPKTHRYDLIRAAALLVAEIERLDRAAKRQDKTRQAAIVSTSRFGQFEPSRAYEAPLWNPPRPHPRAPFRGKKLGQK